MSEMGARLRQERRRLGFSQREMGFLGGVAANAQGKYESGERVPKADYLSALASEGVDILYVLTGNRSGGSAVDNLIKKAEHLHAPDAVITEVKDAVHHLLVRIEELSGTQSKNGRVHHPLRNSAASNASE